MRRCVTLPLLMIALLIAGPAHAAWVLWDDFSGVFLDPSRWFGRSEFGLGTLEEFVLIDALLFPTPNPQLLIARRIRGSQGASFFSMNPGSWPSPPPPACGASRPS